MENATLRAPSEDSKLPHSLMETLFSDPYQKLSIVTSFPSNWYFLKDLGSALDYVELLTA